MKWVARGDSEALSAGDPSIKSRCDVLMTASALQAQSADCLDTFFCFLYETELPAVAVWRITGERTQKSLPRQSRIHLIQQQSWIPIWEDSAKPGIMCRDNVVFIGNFFFSVGGWDLDFLLFFYCRHATVGNRQRGNNVNDVRNTLVYWENWYHAHICRIRINLRSRKVSRYHSGV